MGLEHAFFFKKYVIGGNEGDAQTIRRIHQTFIFFKRERCRNESVELKIKPILENVLILLDVLGHHLFFSKGKGMVNI